MGAEENLRKVEAGFAAVNARDVTTFIGLLDPEFQLKLVVRPPMLGLQQGLSGADQLRYYFDLVFSAMPDFHLDQVALRANGNMVYHEVIARGTHQVSFTLPGGVRIPATGQRIEMPVEVYHTFDPSGRYMSSTVNVNMIDVLKNISP